MLIDQGHWVMVTKSKNWVIWYELKYKHSKAILFTYVLIQPAGQLAQRRLRDWLPTNNNKAANEYSTGTCRRTTSWETVGLCLESRDWKRTVQEHHWRPAQATLPTAPVESAAAASSWSPAPGDERWRRRIGKPTTLAPTCNIPTLFYTAVCKISRTYAVKLSEPGHKVEWGHLLNVWRKTSNG